MDQKKIGSFLKELRNEKGLTQEQLAEKLQVSNRTVSRWETGSNMPDISLLVEIADFYNISITEIVDGERKNEKMNEEIKNVAEAMSDYAGAEKEKIVKDVRNLSLAGFAALVVYFVLDETGLYAQNALFEKLYMYVETLIYVTVFLFPMYTTGLVYKIQRKDKSTKFDSLPKAVRGGIICIVAFAAAAIIKLFLLKVMG